MCLSRGVMSYSVYLEKCLSPLKIKLLIKFTGMHLCGDPANSLCTQVCKRKNVINILDICRNGKCFESENEQLCETEVKISV